MPVTAFHLGPGIAAKAVLGRHVSLMVFAFSQVAMDVEPVAHVLRGDAVLHGFAHTYVGAALVAALSIVAGRPVCQWLLQRWPPDPDSTFLSWLVGPTRIPWRAAIVGAVLGTYSHIFLDSIMHADMQPLAPFVETNTMLGAISTGSLHLVCLASGGLGVVALALVFIFRRGTRTG